MYRELKPALDGYRIEDIHRHGWWEDLTQCCLYNVAGELVASSPKLRHIIAALDARSDKMTMIPTPHCTMFHEVPMLHKEKFVIAIQDPTIVFFDFLCLHRRFSSTERGPSGMMGVIRDGSGDRAGAVRRFQLETQGNKRPFPDIAPSLDVVLLATPVAGTSLTLDRCDKVFLFDYDDMDIASTKGIVDQIGLSDSVELVLLQDDRA